MRSMEDRMDAGSTTCSRRPTANSGASELEAYSTIGPASARPVSSCSTPNSTTAVSRAPQRTFSSSDIRFGVLFLGSSADSVGNTSSMTSSSQNEWQARGAGRSKESGSLEASWCACPHSCSADTNPSIAPPPASTSTSTRSTFFSTTHLDARRTRRGPTTSTSDPLLFTTQYPQRTTTMARSGSEDDSDASGSTIDDGHIVFNSGNNRTHQSTTHTGSTPSTSILLKRTNPPSATSSSAIHHRHSFTSLRQSSSSSSLSSRDRESSRINGYAQTSSGQAHSSGYRERERDRHRSDHPPSYSETESADNAGRSSAPLASSSYHQQHQHPQSHPQGYLHPRAGPSSSPSSSRPSSNTLYSNAPGSGSSTLRATASSSALASRSQPHIRFLSSGGLTSGDEPDSPPAKVITTTPGRRCAGETETEIDEPPRRLPTTRVRPLDRTAGGTLARLSPVLFEVSRLLAVVPAFFGLLWCAWHVYEGGNGQNHRVDYVVAALWALLTAHQSLSMTTGLLTRWSIYYPLLSTLIRLLALQVAICWPATHFTLTVLNGEKRPAAVWAVIGTTTSVSRAVQIWVTSNLWWDEVGDASGAGPGPSGGPQANGVVQGSGSSLSSLSGPPPSANGLAPPAHVPPKGYYKRQRRWRGGKWGGRRWDWGEVVRKCVLPAGVCYFVMAWAGELRREMAGGVVLGS